jgi:hypothetical protein
MPEGVIRGSCLCGGIRFEITGKPLWMSHCHCSRCRKVGGTTYVSIRAEQFRWVQGKDLVSRYEPEPPFHIVRCFCRVCGANLGEPDTSPKGFPIAANVLDDDPGARPVLHEHVADKPPWVDLTDDLPKFPGAPPRLGGTTESSR